MGEGELCMVKKKFYFTGRGSGREGDRAMHTKKLFYREGDPEGGGRGGGWNSLVRPL